MVCSMTGYGRAQQLVAGRDITVEIKSVNHRYFEFSTRTPRAYGFLDDKLKSFVQSRISRGKVEVYVSIVNVEADTTQVEINKELANAYLTALRELGSELSIPDDLTLSSISRFSDIFTVRKALEDEDAVWDAVKVVLEGAVERFVAMRRAEGERLKEDILSRLKEIDQNVAFVEERSPQTVQDYHDRLYQKIKEVLVDSTVDEQRIITETAIFADRVAVAEETVRLRSHLAQFETILNTSEPVGRKLDFLVQEINREINTIGSKAQDVQVAKVVVEMKSAVEKIREQIQNIE